MMYCKCEYEKIKIIYDYLAKKIKYNYGILNRYADMVNSNSAIDIALDFTYNYGDSFTAYGPLVNHKGVCMGMSKLFKIICSQFGIQCAVVKATDKS